MIFFGRLTPCVAISFPVHPFFLYLAVDTPLQPKKKTSAFNVTTDVGRYCHHHMSIHPSSVQTLKTPEIGYTSKHGVSKI